MSSEAERKSQSSREPSQFAKFYLILYNAVQVAGWSFMLFQLISYYTIDRDIQSKTSLWEYIGLTVIIFQNAAVLEILHVAIGIVKSNLFITTMQVLSRVMVVCGVVIATPTGKVSPGLPLALLAWSVTEIIRYGYYAFNLLGSVPHILVYLRYTTFIALYPIGVTGELLCFYWAQSYVRENKLWSVELPNSINFTFSYFYFMWGVMLSYIPLFPQMYLHMFGQRKKILGGGSGSH